MAIKIKVLMLKMAKENPKELTSQLLLLTTCVPCYTVQLVVYIYFQ